MKMCIRDRQNAASLPADGTASKPTSATATVTEHQTTNETATAPTEPENTGNETDTEADTGRVQGESSASGMTTGTVQDLSLIHIFIAPTGFDFRNDSYFRMGQTFGCVSYLQITSPEPVSYTHLQDYRICF